MGRVDYLAMKTDPVAANELMNSDINELKIAAQILIRDATRLGGIGFGTTVLKWLASCAAILAGDAGFSYPSSSCGSRFLRRNLEGELGRRVNMFAHWMLPAARAHPVIRWVQKFIYAKPWNIKHSRYYPSLGLPFRNSVSASAPKFKNAKTGIPNMDGTLYVTETLHLYSEENSK
ncbi:hypothetical protein ACLB2K_001209 [Fragaria x ananassa]